MPIFWFGLLADLLVFGGISFGLPFLATHLTSYEGFTSGWIGFYFSAPAIAFFLNCLLIRSYTKILPRRLVITCGLIFYATALFCVATSPHQREQVESFVNTHHSVCQRVGVKLVPETDKEKAFSCKTKGTVHF